ncbi:MAG: exodeoxyribonuclease VII large subunit [Candidatus Saccharimonadales bacterium]
MSCASDLVFSVSQFVAVLNQTLEFAYPNVFVVGELANFRVSKNAWIYFNLKDEASIVRCFGTVYNLPGPLEDGMMLKVAAAPRLHQKYGFSLNIKSVQPVGEGSIKKAANLLQAKLAAEGLFDNERKRHLNYPPQSIALITSSQSAACGDFLKVLQERWVGLEINLINVQVQGEPAAGQIVGAIEKFNQMANRPEVMVIVRGGGSAEDLQAFNIEQVVRAISASRIPSLVAIGHERDISLAELAADVRASTPSNAAELLVPDRKQELIKLKNNQTQMVSLIKTKFDNCLEQLAESKIKLHENLNRVVQQASEHLMSQTKLLAALSPQAVLARGFGIIRQSGVVVRDASLLHPKSIIEVTMASAKIQALVQKISVTKSKD